MLVVRLHGLRIGPPLFIEKRLSSVPIDHLEEPAVRLERMPDLPDQYLSDGRLQDGVAGEPNQPFADVRAVRRLDRVACWLRGRPEPRRSVRPVRAQRMLGEPQIRWFFDGPIAQNPFPFLKHRRLSLSPYSVQPDEDMTSRISSA